MKTDVTATIYGLTDGEVRALYYLLEGYRADVELKPTPMTDEEYVKHKGLRCPVCRSGKVALNAEDGGKGKDYWRTAWCEHCGAEWDELFTMTGYSNLEECEP